jgi:hypothetical protein
MCGVIVARIDGRQQICSFLLSYIDSCSLQWIDVRSARKVFGSLKTDRAARVLNSYGQVTKGAWGMSWRQEALKGVEVCEKPGGVDKRALIPGFLNWRTLNT